MAFPDALGCCITTNNKRARQFYQLLRAYQIQPAISFSEIFARTFCQNIVNINGRRCGSYHSCAMILYLGNIFSIAKSPFACTCTNHINQSFGCAIICICTGYSCRICPLHSCFCSNKK